MKCSDCDNLGWVSDEGEQVWGWCRYRRSCPDPDIDRDCPNFALKRPPMLQQLKAENEKLRAELERVKVERDAYQAYFKDLSSKPDCNTCEKRNCDYRPKLGATVRANCPLYSGPQKED